MAAHTIMGATMMGATMRTASTTRTHRPTLSHLEGGERVDDYLPDMSAFEQE